MKSWVTQLRKGAGELVVLAAIREGEVYGYELLQRLRIKLMDCVEDELKSEPA